MEVPAMFAVHLLAAIIVIAAPAQQHDHAMMQRGAHAMGFDQGTAVHHFLLEADGGTIQITAIDAGDADTIGRVRQHLAHVRAAFAAGNFELPAFIHSGPPPGVPVLKARREALGYRYEEIPAGGRVVVTTKDVEARTALHDFLRFQITEHKTGDPLQPK
jgi:hypothetical protein